MPERNRPSDRVGRRPRSFDHVEYQLVDLHQSHDRGGHSYSLGEVGFVEDFPDNTVIGGLINGIGAVGANTDDFVINWDTSTLHPVLFAYSCATCDVVYFGFTFTQFNVTAASAVPEPSSLTTLLTGILGFCVFLNLLRCRTTTRVSLVT